MEWTPYQEKGQGPYLQNFIFQNLRIGQIKLRLSRLAGDNHSCLLCPLVSYE